MKSIKSMMRQQSLILVDIFAASFLFIFVAFLAMFLKYLASFEAGSPSTTNGLKAYSGQPFTSEFAERGMQIQSDNWRHGAFVEVYADKIVTYSRSYERPKVYKSTNALTAKFPFESFLDDVAKDLKRFGAIVEAPGAGRNELKNRPGLAVYIFHTRHYYGLRDAIQERKYYWEEFVIPIDPKEQSEIADGQNNDAKKGNSSSNRDISISPSAQDAKWDSIIDEVQEYREASEARTTSSVPPPVSLNQPSTKKELDDEEIQLLVVELLVEENDAPPDVRRSLIFVVIVGVLFICLMESRRVLSRAWGRYRLRSLY